MTNSEIHVLFAAATLEDLHRFCRTSATALREAHQFTAESYEHSQKLMIWLGGLMGAGIFSVYGLLASAPQPMRLAVLLPWTAGILCATLAGLLAGETKNRNDTGHFARISALELLQLQADKELILKNLPPIIDKEVLMKDPANVILNRWLAATNAAFYLSHAFFVFGILAAATTMIVLGR